MVCLAALPVDPRSNGPSQRVEKYRPNTLEDVSGHKDIITTINKFVEKNVRTPQSRKKWTV